MNANQAIKRSLLQVSPMDAMPGWETRLYRVDYEPGADGSGHHHPVVGLGYVLSGSVLSAFSDEEPVLYRQGESFMDRANEVHTVCRNASDAEPLTLLLAYTVKHDEPVTVNPK
jgi:quercetin dioxygenase-like cupin family protein